MISRLGELTALPAYLHISSYATLAILSLMFHQCPMEQGWYLTNGCEL